MSDVLQAQKNPGLGPGSEDTPAVAAQPLLAWRRQGEAVWLGARLSNCVRWLSLAER